jgi:glucose 1-dehydrogenase
MISGGLGDIGRAIARELVENGASVSIGDLYPAAEARKFLSELERHNVRTLYRELDVASADAVEDWVNETECCLGVPRIIIPCAATATVAGIHQMTPEQWTRELRVNLEGAFHLTQAATARLLHHGLPGRVVFVGSWVADAPHRNLSAYCASKAGLRMICKCMALELAPHGILVNEIAPGYVDGGLSRKVWEQNPGSRQHSQKSVPVLKLITPHEVAVQVVQLCHLENEHMTGSTILMDGGLSLRHSTDELSTAPFPLEVSPALLTQQDLGGNGD